MFFNFKKSFKEKAEKNKAKIIRRDVEKFKCLCIKEFKQNINRGIGTTIIDFCSEVTHEFQDEIAFIVLKELKDEYKNIEFSFSYRHYMNSYQGIKMVAI